MSFKYDRIDKNRAMLLVVDHQDGLYQVTRDQHPAALKLSILAHAELAKIFKLPTVLTTSAERGTAELSFKKFFSYVPIPAGPNGPLTSEVAAMHPDAPLIKRNGEVNAWDSPEFRAAVEAIAATGRNQVILAGITTDV